MVTREFLDGKEWDQTRQDLLPLILRIRAAWVSRERLQQPMKASGSTPKRHSPNGDQG